MDEKGCIILCTTSNIIEAENIAKSLVAEKLAACVSISSPVKSIYTWKNEIVTDKEYVLIIKTLEKAFKSVEQFILQHHSYEVPEIVCFSMERSFEKYQQWLMQNVTG